MQISLTSKVRILPDEAQKELLLSTMQKNIPVHLFEIDTLAPGITVFGLSFMTLFSATLIAKDRESALLQRLYTTPLTCLDFILGYMLPLLPIALGQVVICYLFAIPLGLTVSVTSKMPSPRSCNLRSCLP